MGKKTFICIAMLSMVIAIFGTAMAMTPEEQLGKLIYFDTNLSSPPGQACASCHHPKTGFAEPDSSLPVSEGVIAGRFGTRNAPTSAYAAFSPYFSRDEATGEYVGGQFWDGRAPTLEEQAKGPFLNPVEMNNTKEGVVQGVRDSKYAKLFKRVYGPASLDDVETGYNLIAKAIASFERTKRVNRFSSKFDYYLRGEVSLTAQEMNGLNLFNDPAKGNCAACHVSAPAEGMAPVFSDYGYDNLGIPHNYEIDALVDNAVAPDLGLGGFLAAQGADDGYLQDGKFRTQTLRNIAKTGPYGHNGYFKSLKEVVHFYNTRDVLPACNQGDPGEKVSCWPAPEVSANLNNADMGNLGLTDQEEDDIVAFLMTLTDRYGRDDEGED